MPTSSSSATSRASSLDWLNFHHLRYFWVVAREGSLRRASEVLHVSQPSISAQIHQLEDSLGEKLFDRRGRKLVLTQMGQLVIDYADDIFATGRELLNAVKQRPGERPLRLQVGIADSLPKAVVYEMLKPVFSLQQPIHTTCREGKVDALLLQLAAHRLDIVLADEPAPSSLHVKTFSHFLGSSSITFCAPGGLAAKLKPGFPHSLDNQPAFLPADNTATRMALEKWFQAAGIRPKVTAEFEDAALMQAVAMHTLAVAPVHTVVIDEVKRQFGLREIGEVPDCVGAFYAITAERKLRHPAVVAMTENAQSKLFSRERKRKL
ncbi:MAG TPA: transcriptional activator NhaR [Chthoniobacterales bacterium]